MTIFCDRCGAQLNTDKENITFESLEKQVLPIEIENPYETHSWEMDPDEGLRRVEDQSMVNRKKPKGDADNPYDTIIKKKDPPSKPPRSNEIIRLIASLGGYVNRKSTEPGPQTLWVGLQRTYDLSTAWEAFGPE